MQPADPRYQLLPGIYATPDQEAALDKLARFLDLGDRTFTLVGRGGTGKTTIVSRIVDLVADAGFDVGGGAVSHAAKEVLGESIGDSRVHTVASLLAIRLNESTGEFEPDAWARERGMLPIRNYDVVVIDEASMISGDMLQEILELAKPSAQIIFMGDNVQLPPIGEDEEESPTFTLSYPRNFSRLTGRVRQGEDSPIVPLADLIADNIEGEAKLRALEVTDRINHYDPETDAGVLFCPDEAEAVRMLVEDLRLDPGNPRGSKAVVFNNERHARAPQSVLNLNQTIRRELFGPHAAKQFNVGEIVVAYSHWSPGRRKPAVIHNAISYVVESVSAPYERRVRSRWQGMKFDEAYLAIDVSLCDHRGRRATVPVVEAQDQARFQTDLADPSKVQGALFFRLGEAFANLHYGYAITTHKAQGSTYRNVYVFEDNILGDTNRSSPITKNKSLYVAVTRASHKLVIHSRLNPKRGWKHDSERSRKRLSGGDDRPADAQAQISLAPTTTAGWETPPPLIPPPEDFPTPELGRPKTAEQKQLLANLRKSGALRLARELKTLLLLVGLLA